MNQTRTTSRSGEALRVHRQSILPLFKFQLRTYTHMYVLFFLKYILLEAPDVMLSWHAASNAEKGSIKLRMADCESRKFYVQVRVYSGSNLNYFLENLLIALEQIDCANPTYWLQP